MFLSKGKQLKEFKLQFAHLINEASKTTILEVFNFPCYRAESAIRT